MHSSPRSAGTGAWVGLAVLALPTLLVSMDMTILYLATPALSAELRPTGSELLWISDSYGFLVAGALICMGNIGDQIGRRKLLLVGALFFGLASVLAAFSSSPALLIGARALLGVAGATLLPSTLALIREMFQSPRQRGFAIGIWTTCFTLGGVLGPLVGGFLLEHFWWGSVFLLGVPVMLALLVLGPIFLPEFRQPSGHRLDLLSAAQSLIAVLATIFAVKLAAEHGLKPTVAAWLALGALGGALFLRRQRRIPQPMIDFSLFRSAAFTAALAANTVALFAWVGASLLVAQYLQLVLGLSPMTAGLWTIPPAVACVAGCLGAPVLAQRVPSARIVSASLTLAVVGLAILATLSAPLGLTAIVLGMMVLGIGVSTIVTLGTDLVLAATPAAHAGAASAISETGVELGGALGVAVLGSIGVAAYRGAIVVPSGIGVADDTAARDTLAAALEVAALLPAGPGSELRISAQGAFAHGFELATGSGAVVLLGAAIVFAWIALGRPLPSSRVPEGES